MTGFDRRSYDFTKRVLDVLIAGVLLLVSTPLQLLMAVLVRMKHGSPVLFRQDRPGLKGEVFELIKFRSMKNLDAGSGLVTDADRLTNFGRFMRSTSLDELPTLWNVLKGDMSLVGPRPLLVSYLQRYSPEQMKRHDVRPGITGLAQVRGRNSITWNEKFALDLEYVEKRSFSLDARILIETIKTVFLRTGISADSSATMPEFIGNETALKSKEELR